MSMGEGQQETREGQQVQGEDKQIIGDLRQAMGEGPDSITSDIEKQIVICRMCQGKGYYEEIGQPEIITSKVTEPSVAQKICMFPNIVQQQTESHKLEELFKATNATTLSRISDSAVGKRAMKPNSRFPPIHIPNTSTRGRKTYSSAGPVKSSPNNTSKVPGNLPHLVNLLPPPVKLNKHPEDVTRLAIIKLNRDEWETKKAALEECLQLSRFNPEELESHMNLVYRTMSTLLNNFRPQVTLFICQIAGEFFARIRSTCRPEFDELVYSLLSRTADTNKYIRLYANDSLDKMVTYIPTAHAARPIIEKGPIHNNPLVRTATARLLTCIVALKTPNVILTHINLRETCKRILETATLLLADSNLDTRAGAKKLFQRFINEDEFESFYYAEVHERLRKRVDHIIVQMKYKKHMQAN